MGFVATPDLGHDAVELGVVGLARLAHRGGLDADGKSGDGAGLLIQVPQRLLGGDIAVVVLFEWDARAKDLVTAEVREAGLSLAEWRSVPVDESSLGTKASSTMPGIWQGLIETGGLDPERLEQQLYRVRRRAERKAAEAGVRLYIPPGPGRPRRLQGPVARAPPGR